MSKNPKCTVQNFCCSFSLFCYANKGSVTLCYTTQVEFERAYCRLKVVDYSGGPGSQFFFEVIGAEDIMATCFYFTFFWVQQE